MTEQHFHFHLDYILLEDQTNGLVGGFVLFLIFVTTTMSLLNYENYVVDVCKWLLNI